MPPALLRRRAFPFYIRYPALALAYGVGVPLVRLLEFSGQLPRWLRQGQGKRQLLVFRLSKKLMRTIEIRRL